MSAPPDLARTAGRKRTADLGWAMFFLAPNLLGFLLFVAFPLAFSLYVSFTNWSLVETERRFVGLDNYARLLADHKFWFYFVNTLYFMAGIPLGIAGALCLALALNRPIDIRSWRTRLLLCAVLVAMTASILWLGRSAYASLPGWLWILAALTLGIGLLAVFGGVVAFRTLFYLPSFTQGVATMVLWKSLYRTQGGPINQTILAATDWMAASARVAPAALFWVAIALTAAAAVWVTLRLVFRAIAGEYNRVEMAIGLAAAAATLGWVALRAPLSLAFLWAPAAVAAVGAIGSLAIFLVNRPFDRISSSFFAALLGRGLALLLLALAALFFYCWMQMPSWRIEAPRWLDSTANLLGYDYGNGFHGRNFGLGARDAIVIMGLWAAVGGNTMLLYLAGLSNVPPELYEAADIDGAGRWQRFWNVTWPQLAPTTFLVIVMATIGGLQGGFEQARVLTQGKPAETTVTLSYYIYTRAFEQFQLGSAAAVSWFLFLIIFVLTLVNWRFGNRAMND